MGINSKNNVGDMLAIKVGNIVDPDFLKEYEIDTIVNAAKPTMMGSDNVGTVDYAIHTKINELLSVKSTTFKDEIKKELNEEEASVDNKIRCGRGGAVITGGYGLCEHIIHVVGTESDAKDINDTTYSFSRVQKLADCYYNIVEILKGHREIRNVAIPIVSTGSYNFNYIYAFKVAVATIGNALLEWKIHDEEFFRDSGLVKIYFIVNTDSDVDKREAENIFYEYQKMFKLNKKVVYQGTLKTELQILKDIRCYDETRGYFMIAKWTRYVMMLFRMLFLPLGMVKEIFGGKELAKRRMAVEMFTICKALVPLVVYEIVTRLNVGITEIRVLECILLYLMVDTITYLLSLVLIADIQPPSANIIRSMILFFVNYLEVMLETSVLYFLQYLKTTGVKLSFDAVLHFGVFGESVFENAGILEYVHNGIEFLFLTLILGYFAIHMKPKKFMS